MEFVEEVAESPSPPRTYSGTFGGGGSGGGGSEVIRNDVYNRLIENRNKEVISNPDFREELEAHFKRLPPRYGLDINMDRVEDVLLHRNLLARAQDPTNHPVFHIRFIENVSTEDDDVDEEVVSSVPRILLPQGVASNGGQLKERNSGGDFETCSKLEDLNLEVRRTRDDIKGKDLQKIFRKGFKG